MNKFVMLLGVGLICFFLIYVIINQAVSISYLRAGLESTEKSLNLVIKLVNSTDLTKDQIIKILETDTLLSGNRIFGDTIEIDEVDLIFQNNRLKSISVR
ncbi:hypothetical protein [Dyadobacter crusticola]|uniref:hypothetical protein n=1 Tax=Dyadobacter crusticola TaxID=292407 RepID=UPI0012F76051|nr:hypothetical protein [Dyadobacter crusticola]